jgi:hypothetical protein
MAHDISPLQRVLRMIKLVESDLPGAREVGAREFQAMLASTYGQSLKQELCHLLLGGAACGPPAAKPNLPDTPWRVLPLRSDQATLYRQVRRLNGRMLEVVELEEDPQHYHITMDGYHLPSLGAPWVERDLSRAVALAEAAAEEDCQEQHAEEDEA